jgi:hypothetical protein
MKPLLSIALLVVCGVAQAAKVPVSLITPTQNEPYTDDKGVAHPASPLTDLAKIIIEWGTCSGTAFAVRQAAVEIQTTATGTTLRTFVYPTGIAKVCVRAYAINADGVSSVASATASKDLLPAAGKPVTLGQPVVLP